MMKRIKMKSKMLYFKSMTLLATIALLAFSYKSNADILPKKMSESIMPNSPLSKESFLDFVNTRYHAYFHYNMCTFKNINSEKRHGRTHGDDPATLWHPSGLDCEQWAQVCKDSKMASGWLTTKHHGGFCLTARWIIWYR